MYKNLVIFFCLINSCFSNLEFYNKDVGEQIARNDALYKSALSDYSQDCLFDNILIEWEICVVHFENKVEYKVSFKERKPIESRWVNCQAGVGFIAFYSNFSIEKKFTFFTLDFNPYKRCDEEEFCDLIEIIKEKLTDEILDLCC